MSEIMDFIQIAAFIAGGVWVVAMIKSSIDLLKVEVKNLTSSIDELRKDLSTHDERITKIEGRTYTSKEHSHG